MIDRADRGKFLFLGSIAVSAVLVLAYLAAGGSDYAPAKTQDPCKPREWRNPEGLQEIAAAVLALGARRRRLQARRLPRDPGPGAGHRRIARSDSSTATTSTTPSWPGRSAPACCGRSTTPKKPAPSARSLAVPAAPGDPLDPARPGDRTGQRRPLAVRRRRLDRRPRRSRPRPARRLPARGIVRLYFLKVNFWDFAFQRIPAQSSSGSCRGRRRASRSCPAAARGRRARAARSRSCAARSGSPAPPGRSACSGGLCAG